MARIRILELPSLVLGEAVKTPFALVIDQVAVDRDAIRTFSDEAVAIDETPEITQAQADAFARTIGAQGAIVTSATLNVEV